MRTLSIETSEKIGEQVLLRGWIDARRNMGKIVFLDLRDFKGKVQVVGVPTELDEQSQKELSRVRPEWVVEIAGIVNERGERQKNPDLPTGNVEVLAKRFTVLNESKTPPFEIDKDTKKINEELRLKYRYLDLRSERMSKNIRLRYQIIKFIRDFLHEKDFVEISTPMLTKSTPEGARDFLVPSRIHAGKFYALPQSPQQYKQLLMVGGFERYFQIAPCFRDEDARADRSPGEFYQLDLEMSFVNQNDILELTEQLFIELVKAIAPDKKITSMPFPRLSYKESMEKYGTDSPDLREDKKDANEFAFAWVVDFPLFTEQTEDDFFHGAGDKWAPSHHMFTMPKEEDMHLLDTDTGKVRSYQHDLVLNGVEIAGGSIRIHDPKIQEKVFDLIGFNDDQKKQFAHLLEAFEFGVPPHGGIAPGLDRFVRILAGEENIREVVAFPKTNDARDLVMGAPSEVGSEQLKEVHIKLDKS
ncbi:MAG: aspartate--tRNA ligase [bacterium]